ncbi:DUF4232 domain-containing protein (plasmid) [Streptomyces sp. NBC_00053]|uniref:DUF4232 domain-containing protein n=1 Tax=unclassified Streptomyces TaxID=2593676 RepID=UPI000F93797E|nr:MULTISPECIES: DUF4232 domain-containing protein [unclassified Streptomyces]WSG56474.1 DUF4232 domain-containing protein [Streptomyces sp. NBC_01732]WSX07638.1 DUF4232 domain-containing protein [Streptomyces sp. NBC_00987]MCX4399648.1 DUF4232 domain-containing protein [Streptomyces sp. NBC_01767]MCX5106557.1 DUF4232 domain-containing protein [Streptomyces sp. NBC_00439]MCX5165608.1 DUF4232 domain-containing protein [Streptomyces sp. NBC_00305]
MRSRLAARSTRLVLAAAAVTALAATTTACGTADATETGASAVPSAASSSAEGGKSEAPSDGSAKVGNSLSANSSTSGGTRDKSESSNGDKSGYGQSCGTNDLDFTVTWEAQPISYYLVTAKAKSGITCYLDVNTPSVSFGSRADGVASPVGQGGEDPIKLSGSSVAYAGINVKTTEGEGGTQFEFVTIATSEDDPNPAEVELPDAPTVDKPIVTNWSTKRNEVIPRII